MSTVTKFTFDLDFDAPEEPEAEKVEEEEIEPEEIIPTFSEEELEQARAEGFEAGKEEGRREAADATEQKLLETVEAACSKLSDIYNTQTEANRDIAREMISVSTAISKKMFPDLNARNALGEVERVVQETLKAVTEEPRIQIMVNPDLREPLTERLGTMTHRAGFEGKVFVNPDPTMALGDCRIEWSNGAAVRDGEELWEMIDRIIEHNLHGPVDIDPDDDTEPAGDTDRSETPSTSENAETRHAEPEQEAAEQVPPTPEPVQSEPDHDGAVDDTAEYEETVEDVETSAPEEEPEPAPATDAAGMDTADASPSWEDVMSESQPAEAAGMPDDDVETVDALSEEEEIATSETPDDGQGAHAFTPSLDDDEPSGEDENPQSEQPFTDDEREAPVPHVHDLEGEDDTAGAEVTGGDAAAAPVSDPDPVSPATQAAILDAQSAMNEDDDRDPSGG